MISISDSFEHPDRTVYILSNRQKEHLAHCQVKYPIERSETEAEQGGVPTYYTRYMPKFRHAQRISGGEITDQGAFPVHTKWRFKRVIDVYDETGKYVYSYGEMSATDYYNKVSEGHSNPYPVAIDGTRAFNRVRDDGVILALGRMKCGFDLSERKVRGWTEAWVDAIQNGWRDGEFVTIEGAKAWPYKVGVTSRCGKCDRLIVRERRRDE